MALYGALAKENNLSELGEPLDVGGNVTTAAERREEALRNLTGITAFVVADMQKLRGILATADEINNVADVSGRVQELTETGAVTAGVQSVELNHNSTIIAATIADASNHPGFFIVKNTSASGTAEHTLTLTSGTFDGTNDIATLAAPNEALVVYFDSAGNGTIIENVGSVALSSS